MLSILGIAANNVAGGQAGSPLGVEDGTILDSAMTASSEYTGGSPTYLAEDGRLDNSGAHSYWSPNVQQTGEWLQIDLGSVVTVTAVETQGANDGAYWTTAYDLEYSDTDSWPGTSYSGNPLSGNTGVSDTKVKNNLTEFTCRYIRFKPTTWSGGFIALRVEVWGY